MPSDKKDKKHILPSDKVDAKNGVLRKKMQDLEQDLEQAPEDLKEDVFNALDKIQLFADILDLFTVKFSQAEVELFDTITSIDRNE